jgi:hypothetical protein
MHCNDFNPAEIPSFPSDFPAIFAALFLKTRGHGLQIGRPKPLLLQHSLPRGRHDDSGSSALGLQKRTEVETMGKMEIGSHKWGIHQSMGM